MKFVIPVSQSDVHLLPKTVVAFKHLGGWKNHSILLAGSPSCAPQCAAAAQELKEVCGSVQHESISSDHAGGWPAACNKHFYDTVVILERMGNQVPWMWFELDCTPIRANWQDILETAYNRAKTPFMGHVRPTAEVTKPPEKGSHMVGAGIYPANFGQIAAAEYRAMPKNLPFDIYLRWRVTRSGVTNTPLIAHAHNTHEYTHRAGNLEPVEGMQIPVKKVVVVHGCKDGTLVDLLMGGSLELMPPLELDVPPVVTAPTPPGAPVVAKPTLESQMTAKGWRKVMDGVWAHPAVTDEQIQARFGVTASGEPLPPKPISEIDRAIETLMRKGGSGNTLPGPGVDNAVPPVHTETVGSEPLGENTEATSVAASGSEPQTGQPPAKETKKKG